MSDAEVMTTALTAALFFRGTLESARVMLKQYGYIPQMLSKSHFSRRLHRLKETFLLLFQLLGTVWKKLNTEAIYAIDSLPIPTVCLDVTSLAANTWWCTCSLRCAVKHNGEM
jgi:hypothetical protein